MRAALSCSLAAITALGSGWFNDAKFDLLTAGADFNNDRYFLPALGNELVTNGTFDTDLTGWVIKFDGDISWQASGRIRVTANGGANGPRAMGTLSGLTVGKPYAFTFSVISSGNSSYAAIGTLATGSISGNVAQTAALTSSRTETVYFTATQTTHYVLLLHNTSVAGQYTEFDNVSVKEVILDKTNGKYPKRAATFAEWFAFTASSTAARSYTASDGTIKTMDTAPYLGPELIQGGDFSTPNAAWLLKTPVGTESAVIGSGVLTLTHDGTNTTYADQSFPTVPGQPHTLTFDITNTVWVSLGTNQGGSALSNIGHSAGSRSVTFTPSTSTVWVRFLRATTGAAVVDNVSVKQVTSVDTPRFTWANGKRQLRLEDQRTNSIRNNTMQGVVAGNPGSTPTNWAAFPNNGLSRDVIGTGVENGREYVEIRYFGTPSATGSFDIVFDNANTIAAANGQTWTLSTYTKLTGGSVTNLSTVTLYLFEYDGASAFLATSGQSFTPGIFMRTSHTRTLTGATTAFIRGLIKFNDTSGQAIDITLRVYRPQLEQGAFASDDIPTGGSAVTRAIETARLSPLLEAILQRSAGSVVVRGDLSWDAAGLSGRRILGSDAQNAYLFASGTDTIISSWNSATALAATIPSGGKNWQPFGAAMAFDASGRALSVNGSTAVSDANLVGTHTVAYLGRDASAAANTYADGFYDFVGISPERLSNSNLQSMAVAA